MTDRRSFVRATLGAAVGMTPILNVGSVAAASGRLGGDRGQQDDWVDRARRQLPAATNTTYFQTGGIGPCPTPVIDEVSRLLRYQNRSPAEPRIAERMAAIEPDLRAHFAAAFGARTEEVALTHSTSEGISIAAWSVNWQRGDEVIISNQEHPANVIPWYILRDRFGVRIRTIDLTAGTDLLDEVSRALSARTRMVSLSHVSRNNGRAIPAAESAELGALLRQRGVLYHLDGAQGPGCVPTDFAELGCDCYSTCGHKWLLAPKGTGAFLVRRDRLDEVGVSWAGAHSHATMDYDGQFTYLPSAARYEFGTRALADFGGFDHALTWMESIGLTRITDRIDELVAYAIDVVNRHPRLSVSSPTAELHRSGVFVARLPAECDALALYHTLRNEANVLASPVKWDHDFRLSIHFFNTTDEIDEAVRLMGERCP